MRNRHLPGRRNAPWLDLPWRALLIIGVLPLLAAACFPGATASPATSATASPTASPSASTPASLPDFKLVAYTREPPEPVRVASGSKVRFHLTVRNEGKADYAHPIVVSGPGLGGGVNGLAAGEMKEAILEWSPTCSSSGETTFNIVFTVDPDNVTPEVNETNNTWGPVTAICV